MGVCETHARCKALFNVAGLVMFWKSIFHNPHNDYVKSKLHTDKQYFKPRLDECVRYIDGERLFGTAGRA